MPQFCPTVTIGSGIRYTEVIDPKFRNCSVYLQFYVPRSAETVSAYSMLKDLLSLASKAYPTQAALSLRLESLYASGVSAGISACGDYLVFSLTGNWLDDRYTLEGESITNATLDVILGCLLNPNAENGAFEEKLFRYCKQNLLDDIDCEINDKRGYALRKLAELTYAGEPSAVSLLGTKETAEQLTPESVYAVWQEMLRTADIDIVAVLPEQKPQLQVRLTEAFSGLARRPITLTFEQPSPCKEITAEAEEQMPVEQCKLCMAMKYPTVDYDVIWMLNFLLSGTTSSLFFSNVREKRSLCYYCASRNNWMKHTIVIDSGVKTEQLEEAKAAILEQIDILRAGTFTNEQMTECCLMLEHAFRTMFESPKGTASYVFTQHEAGKERSVEEILAARRAVTREQIMEAAAALQLDSVWVLRTAEPSNEQEGAE